MSRLRTVFALILIAGASCKAGLAGDQRALEYQVKAAYLYNFAKFVTWPEVHETNAVLSICVIGKDPFGPILDEAVQGKTVHGQPIVVKRLAKNAEPQGCQIAFLDLPDDPCRLDALSRANWEGILVVGEGDEFAKCGGMIGLTLREGRVQFDINVENLSRAHLEVSSKLLQLASIVSSVKRK